jgi:hypothetical protein
MAFQHSLAQPPPKNVIATPHEVSQQVYRETRNVLMCENGGLCHKMQPRPSQQAMDPFAVRPLPRAGRAPILARRVGGIYVAKFHTSVRCTSVAPSQVSQRRCHDDTGLGCKRHVHAHARATQRRQDVSK